MGDVLPFPIRADEARPRSCFNCAAYAGQISWCATYLELIDSELFAAADCDAYEEIED